MSTRHPRPGTPPSAAGSAWHSIASLPFVTAGLAFGANTLSVNGAADSTTQVGFALGAGVEGMVTDRISLRGEFLYEGFGDQTHNVSGKSVNTNISTGILRIGAAYKF